MNMWEAKALFNEQCFWYFLFLTVVVVVKATFALILPLSDEFSRQSV